MKYPLKKATSFVALCSLSYKIFPKNLSHSKYFMYPRNVKYFHGQNVNLCPFVKSIFAVKMFKSLE